MKILSLLEAQQALRNKKIVALPTETVYGLAGSALHEESIHKIYRIKKRSFANPLICHLGRCEDVEKFAYVNHIARKLFVLWPDSFTLILPSRKNLPASLNQGGDFLAFRIPSHPICLKILQALRFPVAMPSANLSERESPTNLAMIASQIGRDIEGAVWGTCRRGIESTIIKVQQNSLEVLRLGAYPIQKIKELGFPVAIRNSFVDNKKIQSIMPGHAAKHYAPKIPLLLLTDNKKILERFTEIKQSLLKDGKQPSFNLKDFFHNHPQLGKRIGYLSFIDRHEQDKIQRIFDEHELAPLRIQQILYLSKQKDYVAAMRKLYSSFFRLEKKKCTILLIRTFEEHELAAILNDRLIRAATWCLAVNL